MSPRKNIARKNADESSAVGVKAGEEEANAQRLVRELKMRNEALVRSQVETQALLRQYEDLYDSASIGYFTLGSDGAIHRANLSGAGLLGMERDRLIGQNFGLFVSAAFCSTFDSFLEKMFSSRGKETCEIMLLKKKREAIWTHIEATYSDVSYEHGACHLVVNDISEQKRTEHIQQARLRITEFAAEHSLEELLQNALDELCNLTDSPIGFFHFVEPDQCTLSLQAWSTRTLNEMCTAEGKGRHYNIDEAGVWVDCVRKRRPVIHNDYSKLPHRKGLPQGHAPVIREMTFPIIRHQKVVAVIGVGNKLLDYTHHDVSYALRLADLVWDITERKRAEEALRQSEARYRSILEDQTELICRYLPDGRLSYVNEAYSRYYGEAAQKLINTNFLPNIPEPDLSMVLDKISTISPQEPAVVYEHRIIKPDGEVRWQRWTHRGIYDTAGKLIEHQAVGNDITERKQAEETIRENEERFRYILENVQDAVWSATMTGQFISISPVMERIYGRPLGEMMANSAFWIEATHPEDRDIARASVKRLFRDKKAAAEYRIIRSDGAVRWISDRKFIMQDENNEPVRLAGIVSDITERKQMESALATERRRLADIIKGTNAGTWEWNVQTGETIYNERWAEIIGYTLDELSPLSINTWANLVHPDDLKRSDELLEKHVKGELDYYECEVRMRHKNGRWVWVLDRGKVSTWTEDGRPLLISGTHQDITERKHSEEQIQFLAKFPGEDPNPVLRVSRDGMLLYVNDAGMTLLSNWNLHVGQTIPGILQKAVFQSMNEGKTQTIDLEHGDRLYAFYIAPIASSAYANLYGRDITESRQVKALRDAETRYRVLFEQSPYGVLLVDPETGSVIEANDITSKQLGYTREEFIGMKLSDFEATEDPQQIAQHTQKIINEGSDDFETLHRTKNGEIRNVHVWVKTLPLEDRVFFYTIFQDITERKQMEEANETYSREIALLEERQRIASDLHDAVSQALFSARLTAENLLRQTDRQSDSYTRSLIDLNRLVRSASGEIRLVLVELRSNALQNVSLNNLLANLIDSGMARTNANLVFQCHVDELVLPAPIKLAFYRIAQEAISNAIKHARPANIHCILKKEGRKLEMVVRDDGTGFSMDKVSDDNFGLQIMRERAEQVGLGLNIVTQPGRGTSVIVEWQGEDKS